MRDDVTIYGRIEEVKEDTVEVACIMDEETGYIEHRLFKKEHFPLTPQEIFKGNFIKIHMTSGPGWMQADYHTMKTSEMHHVTKLLTNDTND